jgi:hypothetical protein
VARLRETNKVEHIYTSTQQKSDGLAPRSVLPWPTEVDVIDTGSFVADGYVRIEGAVPRALAVEIRERAAQLVADDSGVPWQLGMASVYDLPVLIDAVTPAVRAAFDALAGAGRWHLAAVWGFPTRFPGPGAALWHIDGDWFTHHLTSSDQVLTPIFLWSDVGTDDSPNVAVHAYQALRIEPTDGTASPVEAAIQRALRISHP